MDLEQLRQILNKVLPNEKEAVNNLIALLETFFSEKEDLLKLEEKEQFAQAWAIFANKHKDLPILLDHIDNRIKDRQVSKLFKNITGVIKYIFGALEKYDMNAAHVFQQRLVQLIEEVISNLEMVHDRRTPPSQKAYFVEASGYFREQRDKSNVFDIGSVHTGIGKIERAAIAGLIPRKPQPKGMHCYGSTPNHLNSVLIGSDRRLVFYIHPNETGTVIRLCAYIDAKTHNDAVNAIHERPGNIYWLIINHRINKLYFSDFKRIDLKTLEDL